MKLQERMGNSILGIRINNGICNHCKHINDDGQTCKAFPNGIPSDILTGKFDHKQPYESDNNIQYESVERN
jgi:hypothetical protein